MLKLFIPFAKATSIYDIDLDFFVSQKVKTLIMDLDNTLDSYKLYHPKQKTVKLIAALRAKKINPVIISNNKGKRVSTYANDLQVDYINSARKPFSFKIKEYIKNNNLNRNEVMMVGDQLMTDVLAAKGAKIRIILTNKLVEEDQWTTHINRFFERPIRNYHERHNHFVDWRTIYGKSKKSA